MPRLIVSRTVLAVVWLVAGVTAFAFVLFVWESQPRSLPREAFTAIVGAVGLGAFVFSTGILWRLPTELRSRRLQVDRPGSVAVSVERVDANERLLSSSPASSRTRCWQERTPVYFSITATSQGLGIWGGRSGAPSEYLSVPWASIGEVSLGEVRLGLLSVAALRIELVGSGTFEFPVLGRRIGGLGWASRSEVATLVDRLHSLEDA
jgi:hypothetical protein